MNRLRIAIAPLILFLLSPLPAQRAAAKVPTTTLATGAILAGYCAGGGPPANSPTVVFMLGQVGNIECTFQPGTPTRGVPMPSAGTLLYLRVTDDVAEQGSVITVYVNGQATALTCAVSSTGKCSDTSHKVSVKAGDEVAATYTSATGSLSNTGMVMTVEKQGG